MRERDLEAGQAGATRRWFWSEWLARRARLPYLLRRLIIVALVLFVVGAYKAHIYVGNPGKSGLEMAVIGTLSALVGYGVGLILRIPSNP